MTKSIAYTPAITAAIVEQYQAGETLEQLATAFGKSVPMIRSKLVSEQVYIAQEKKAVGGASAVRKSHIVKQIADKLDIVGLASFEKGSKVDLQILLTALTELVGE